MKKILFCTLLFFSFHKAYSQISESFESSFPPTGWSVSHEAGTSDWTQISSNARSGTKCVSSTNPTVGANKSVILNLDVSLTASTITYYISVSSITLATGANLKIYAGTSLSDLVLLRTIDLETLASLNTYYEFIDYIDGNTNQSGNTINLTGVNSAYIKWVHNKISGTAASCRLDDVYILNAAALPVELTNFATLVNGTKVKLLWSTATEVNNYGFNVERRTQNEEWNKIGFVQGSGNSNSPKHYTFTDQLLGGIYFKYRLKQIDFDGTYEYSNEVDVTLYKINNFTLEQNYPNPFNPTTTIRFSLPIESFVTLKVFNLLGEQVSEVIRQSLKEGFHEIKFNGSNLASGVYFYHLNAGDFNATRKFIVAR